MALLGDIERGARGYRIEGGPGTGKTALEERLVGAFWRPARNAVATIIVVDALKGVDAHASAALVLAVADRVPHLLVAVNKMDLAGYEYETFKAARSQVDTLVGQARAGRIEVIPVSARFGDNVITRGDRIDWYVGHSLVDALTATAQACAHHGG